ncbi:YggT family protein [Pantoea sp. Nvir]|uniref:YggT family protein n=1 Tax=Pantoea sp. Nvir TaxID=2576760 RepID=UPI0013580FF3|nr:YggT family protein [Pantoea sp. Nvir]MXP66761.1 YggT family protein [Pantoea sp. Nvir]CAJ0990910.1 hypothetical protein NVIRPANT_00114 [Pantoea sp. Nvir]
MFTLTFLVNTLIDLYMMMLLLRVWMKYLRCDFYNPFLHFVLQITQPIIKSLHRIIPDIGSIDSASLFLAFMLATLKYPILLLMHVGVFSMDATNFLVGLLALLKSTGYLVFWVIIIRSLMSWISSGRSPLDYILIQLTEPLMAPIRHILPVISGIDFSAMIVILILYALNFLGMDLFPSLWYLL